MGVERGDGPPRSQTPGEPINAVGLFNKWGSIVHEGSFDVGEGRTVSICVRRNGEVFKTMVRTNVKDAWMHWAISIRNIKEWLGNVPEDMWPSGSVSVDRAAVRSPFRLVGNNEFAVTLEFKIPFVPMGLNFVVNVPATNEWLKPDAENFLFPVAPSEKASDLWEKIRVRFSIYKPLPEGQRLHITGDGAELGNWGRDMVGYKRMSLGDWRPLPNQSLGVAGLKVRPWEYEAWIPARVYRRVYYRYLIWDEATESAVWEREPNRVVDMEGEGARRGTKIVQNDINFVSDLDLNEITGEIFSGSYPQTDGDVEMLRNAGITAVLNVMTEEDLHHRQVNWIELLRSYDLRSIRVERLPIRDFDQEELLRKLGEAVRLLDRLVREGHKVFVHCTAGISRAPAIVLSYLVWCRGYKPDGAFQFIKQRRPVAMPNMQLITPFLQETKFEA
eukprot:tig00000711_g3394.t1